METQKNGTANGAPIEHGLTVRDDGLGNQQLARSAETVSTALAEQARAAIQSRFQVALARPRDLMQVRESILKDCSRPLFAETARYSKPIGGNKVEGWSIRFAESAIRAMKNVLVETQVLYDDAEKRLVRVTVTDLESNTTYPSELMIAKTVERRQVKEGQNVLGRRVNSYGKEVYLVESSEDELLVKQAALVSKALRTAALRLIPGDILDEALARVVRTKEEGAGKEDISNRRKGLVDAFASLGISAANLAEYLGHGVDTTTPDELADLRLLGQGIKDGETNWREIMASKTGEQGAAAVGEDKAEGPNAAEKLKERLQSKKGPQAPAAPAPQPAAKAESPAQSPTKAEPKPEQKPEPTGPSQEFTSLQRRIAETNGLAPIKATLEDVHQCIRLQRVPFADGDQLVRQLLTRCESAPEATAVLGIVTMLRAIPLIERDHAAEVNALREHILKHRDALQSAAHGA